MKPEIWAHRGASGYAPENTIAAFRLANEMKADGIELDVQFTADKQVVVVHDSNVKRVTGMDAQVCEYSLETLKRFDFSNNLIAYAGERIPTLEEVLKFVATSKMKMNIELKTDYENPCGLEEKVIELVDKYKMNDRVIYSSFNHDSLIKMHQINANIKYGILYEGKLYKPFDYAKSVFSSFVHPNYKALSSPGYVEAAHKAGLAVNVWTVNDDKDMQRMIDLDVDSIMTNYPDVALEFRNNK